MKGAGGFMASSLLHDRACLASFADVVDWLSRRNGLAWVHFPEELTIDLRKRPAPSTAVEESGGP